MIRISLKRKNFCSIFFLVLFLNLHSQIPYYTFTTANGFVSDNIYDVNIDFKGFLWVLTDKGVVRFNGKINRYITTAYGLRSNDNYKCLFDSLGNLWLYSNKEIAKIDQGLNYKHIVATENYFGRFLIDGKGNIHFSKKTSDFNWLHLYISNDSVYTIKSYFDIKNEILISKRHKLHGFNLLRNDSLINYIFDSQNGEFYKQELLEGNTYKLQDKPILDLGLKSTRNIKFYALNETYEFLTSIKEYKLFRKGKLVDYGNWPDNALKISSNNIVFEKNKIIIPTDIGLLFFTIVNDKLELEKSILSFKNCTSIVKDFENNFWISTLGNGLIKLSDGDIKMNENVPSDELIYLINGLKSKKVWGLTTKRVIDIKNQNNQFLPNGLSHARVLVNNDIGLFYGGNNALYLNSTKIIDNVSIKDLSIDDEKVAIALFNGVILKNNKNLNFSKNSRGELEVDLKIKANSILLHEDKLFVAANNGLYVQKITSDLKLYGDLKLVAVTKNTNIILIRKDNTGQIWAVSEDNGVFVIRNNILLKKFEKELLDIEINSLKIDEHDNVWICTKKGINKIHKEGHIFKISTYTSYHGLPSDYVFDSYCTNDTLYVATNKGLAILNLCEIDNKFFDSRPPIYIQDVICVTDNQIIPVNSRSFSILENEKNDLLISYTGISFRSNGNINYEYRLSPSFDEWRYTSNDNITFNDLSSGEYVFEVRAINAIGTKSAQPARYSFVIKKHYTETLWFRTAAFLGLVVVIGAVFYGWFAYKRRKQNEKFTFQRQINELKLKSLQAQMNPHFVFNSLNAVQQFINVENKKAANDYLSRFARLMRMYLTGSDAQFITLQEELNVIQLYCSLEHLRFSDKFTYTFSVEPNLPLDKYNVPAMLLQPHVENAIRHGLVASEKEGNHLLIEFRSLGSNGILCVIEDNGIGREASGQGKVKGPEQHRSLGNKISKERLDLIRSLNLGFLKEQIIDLRDASGAPCGTRVEVTIFSSGQLNVDGL